MENHDVGGASFGSRRERIHFPPFNTTFHDHDDQDACQLVPTGRSFASSGGGGRDAPQGNLCIREYGALTHLSYHREEYGIRHQTVVLETASSSATLIKGTAVDPQLVSTLPDGVVGPLSVEDLVRIAALKFLKSHSNQVTMPSDHDLGDVTLSEEESESVRLTQLLLEAAQEVDGGLFDSARILLRQCHWQSSPTGNPIQRLVFYYSRALRDRIDREIGQVDEQSSDLYKAVMTPSAQAAEFHGRIPFSQVAQFAGIQAIVEHVHGAKKIHIIDLAVKNGQQWTILIQALASRPKRRRAELLKITAVVTIAKQAIEETGSRLVSFAESVGLPCKFKVVVVPDLAELCRDHISLVPGEVVAVLAEYVLNTLVDPVDRLDSLIRAVKSLNPWVMVVGEIEGNMNSPVFINRFVESLFYASAFFDCMEECMGRDEPMRHYGEGTLFGESSKIVSAIEGRERIFRNMKVEVWRAYLQRMGMVEKEMSPSSIYQAHLVARKLSCWMPCYVKMDGKGLMIGWKGTPMVCVTVWNFIVNRRYTA